MKFVLNSVLDLSNKKFRFKFSWKFRCSYAEISFGLSFLGCIIIVSKFVFRQQQIRLGFRFSSAGNSLRFFCASTIIVYFNESILGVGEKTSSLFVHNLC